MSVDLSDELTDVLDRIKTWPPPRRITLARRVLESLDDPAVLTHEGWPAPDGSKRGWPVEKALGLLRSDREPPDDEECRRIVEEERWKKYGS